MGAAMQAQWSQPAQFLKKAKVGAGNRWGRDGRQFLGRAESQLVHARAVWGGMQAPKVNGHKFWGVNGAEGFCNGKAQKRRDVFDMDWPLAHQTFLTCAHTVTSKR